MRPVLVVHLLPPPAARTNEPVRQGLVSMTATFIDTIIICSITGIAIVLTGAYDMGLEGVAVTTKAFQLGLPFPDGVASFILMLCLVFFAFYNYSWLGLLF